jgi:hypothetical protein
MSLVNPMKLLRELIAAGLPVTGTDATGKITLSTDATPEQYERANQILAAHDPTDYVGMEAEASREIIREMYVQVVNDFTAALATWDTLTNAQQKAVLKRCVQVQLYLLRFIRKEFDY